MRLATFLYLSFLSIICFSQSPQIDSLQKVLAATPDDSAKVQVLLSLSKEFFSESPEEAIAYATLAKELAEKLNYQKGIAYALKNIGIAHYIQGDYKDAIPIWEQSLAVFESTGDKVGVSNIYNNIGAIFAEQRDDEKAMDYYLKSLKAGEDANDTFRILTACINLGEMYGYKSKTYDKSLEYLHKGLSLAEAQGIEERIGMATVNLGDVYFKKNDDTLALKYFERSLKAFENTERLPFSLNYIGKVYLKRGDYRSALNYHQQAYNFSKKLELKLEMAQSLLGIAETQRQSGDARQSISTYKQAEAISRELNAGEDLKEIYQGLSLAYSELSQFNNAFKYQNLLLAIKDTLYNIDTDKKLQGLQFHFDMEKKQAEVDLLAKDKELKEQEIARQRLVRNGFVGGLGIAMLFAGVFFTQRNRISKEKKRSDELLLNILPSETAEELKTTGTAKAKSFDSVTVMFTDFKNFTQASEKLSAEELVKEINYCYSEFDKIITKHGIEKIKTIGDSYMCAGGLPVANATHAVDVVKVGLEIQQFIERNKQERIAKGQPYFELRLGIHTGPVVAGVVGTKKFAYDIWGDTVNTAARMQSSGEVGKVNISGATYALVKDKFNCTHRGKIQAKNKGEVDMYFVERVA